MKNIDTYIGEVISVSGNTITVQLAETVKSNMPIIDGIVYRIGQIGSFLKIPLGYATLYGIVSQIGAAAIPENLRADASEGTLDEKNRQFLSLVLVGEQLGNKFSRGVSQSPTTGDSVHIVTIQDLDIVYGVKDSESTIDIGNIAASESLSAKLDVNKFVSRHSAILGSTGSGKSNAVGVILSAIANKGYKSSRVLVIDPHGEYNSVLGDKATVYKIRSNTEKNEVELYVPYWALPFSEFIEVFSGNLSDQNKDYFREKICSAKRDSACQNEIPIPAELISADTPIPYNIRNLWFELDDFERRTFKENRKPETVLPVTISGSAETLTSNEYPPPSPGGGAPFLNHQAKGILGFLDSVRTKLRDSTFSFLFSPGDYAPDAAGKVKNDLGNLLFDWIGSDTPVTILDLSGIPSEIMPSIAGTLIKIIYDALFWGQGLKIGGKEQPLLIVLEEAHNYLKKDEITIASRAVQTISKEGRKYGVGISLISQRPSELDSTVLSQCGTIIALRMNNSQDRSHVKSAIQDELQMISDLLPSLRTGECIVSGEAVKLPSRVQFFKLKNAPKGSDPKVSEKWMEEKIPSIDMYNQLVSVWRNQSL